MSVTLTQALDQYTNYLIVAQKRRLQSQDHLAALQAASKRGNQHIRVVDQAIAKLLRAGGIRGVANDKDDIRALENVYYPLLRRHPLYRFRKPTQKLLAQKDPSSYAECLRRMLENLLHKPARVEVTELRNFSKPAFKLMLQNNAPILHRSVGLILFPKQRPTARQS